MYHLIKRALRDSYLFLLHFFVMMYALYNAVTSTVPKHDKMIVSFVRSISNSCKIRCDKTAPPNAPTKPKMAFIVFEVRLSANNPKKLPPATPIITIRISSAGGGNMLLKKYGLILV